jgi:hypothetical protein
MLLTSLVFLAVTSSSSQQYDPWVDFNEDGAIDIFDIVGVALAFGATGDPTKNVTITNWPDTVTPEGTVWYGDSITSTSANYSGSGFGQLHILLRVLWAGPGSSCEFQVRGIVWDHAHVGSRWVAAYSVVLAHPQNDSLSVTIPVPSETFYFNVRTLSGGGNVYLSYYLAQP